MKNTMKDTAKQLAFIAACAAVTALCGCSVTKVNYKKDDTGNVSYSIYRNEHWLNTEANKFSGGMTNDGKLEFSGEGVKSSPSEEYNKMMGTTMGAFVQMMQIAAAAYNPSSSAAARQVAPPVVQASPSSPASPSSSDCPDGSCKDTDCPDGSCEAK